MLSLVNLSLITFLSSLTLIINLNCINGQESPPKMYPIILVPGYMGTKLEAILQEATDAPVYCLRRTGTWTLWFSLKELMPMVRQCWYYAARLHYDSITRKTTNSKGVTVIVPQFGGLESVEYLSPWFEGIIQQTIYYANMVSRFRDVGLTPEVQIRGAPYDWRRSMNEMDEWFSKFKTLIEETYTRNGNKSVILVGHSMGGSVVYIFLRKQSQEWKDKYIRLMWTLATPFGGNFKYMYDYLFEDDYPGYLSSIIRRAERTFPSLAFLIPKPEAWGCEPFITSPNSTYTPCNYEDFFRDIGQPKAYEMWKDVAHLQGSFEHPGVPIKCWGGGGQPTLRSMSTTSNNVYDTLRRTVVKESDGDTFVNYQALRVCLKWNANTNYPFQFRTFNKTHMQMIRDSEVLDEIVKSYLELP
ncbi:phospholipase A2 group XV-like [Panonychus citri]|uniref:phospholipase A2 group XV-like n=1 Tax=Panonychus citri TaxID=50023 RepID=UPI002307CFFC|nr:phospholipase A2 group XV-like [Panonychus citri]